MVDEIDILPAHRRNLVAPLRLEYQQRPECTELVADLIGGVPYGSRLIIGEETIARLWFLGLGHRAAGADLD